LCFDDIDKEDTIRDFIIDSNPIPNQLYIKLAPTDIYVKDDIYDNKYFKLRQNELKNIFITLGAKKIKYSVKQTKTNNTNVNLGAGIENNAIGVGQEINFNNSTANCIQEECTLTFDYSEKINDVNYETFNNNNFHFLPKESEWQDIIIRRIKHLQLTDKCILRNNSDIKINKSLKSNFKMAKINCAHSFDNIDLGEIEYEIEYYQRNDYVKKNKVGTTKADAPCPDETKEDYCNMKMLMKLLMKMLMKL